MLNVVVLTTIAALQMILLISFEKGKKLDTNRKFNTVRTVDVVVFATYAATAACVHNLAGMFELLKVGKSLALSNIPPNN